MQLTRFDRWLRETFVYETHVHTMRAVEPKPRGFACVPLPEKPGQRFRFRYITRSTKAADRFIQHLRESGMMFDTRITNRKAWHVRFLAPEGKSPTWWLFSTTTILIFLATIAYGAHRLWANPEIRQNILESIEIFKG